MGLFRRKQRASATHADPWTAMHTPVRAEGTIMLKMVDVERRDQLNLREWASAMFTADFLSGVHVMRAAGLSVDQWWEEAKLDEQYTGGDRQTRVDALRTAMQFNNMLDSSEHDNVNVLALHATVRLKALALALACDVEYGTSYCKQIATEPESFGTRQLGVGQDVRP